MTLLISAAAMELTGCSSGGTVKPDKVVIDSAGSANAGPAWVQDTKTSWIGDGGIHRFKSFYSIRGEERLSACYTLAKLNVQEDIASEIWADFKAVISHSTQGMVESAQDLFQQSRNKDTRGAIQGLRFTDAFHQRYIVNGVERIDCYVLAEFSDADYRAMRFHLLNPVVQADPELRKAIREKHIDLFRSGSQEKNQDAGKRDPAGTTIPSNPQAMESKKVEAETAIQ